MSSRQFSFAPPLPELEAALTPHTKSGNLILCAGLTGAGKTILAGQCAIGSAVAGHQVLFISTQVPREELDVRTISAACDIPYDDIKDRIKTIQYEFMGARLHLPDPARYGIAATEKAMLLREAMVGNFLFKEVESLGFEPQQKLEQILAGYAERKGGLPEVLIYDYLSNPRVTQAEIDPFKAQKAVKDAAEAFAAMAKKHDILVIVFCQADQSLVTNKKIMPENIDEFRSIREFADGFVGISKRVRPDVDTTESEEIYNRVQHLTVVTRTNPAEKLVPVETDFAFQRFEPYRGKIPNASTGFPAVHNLASMVVSRSEFRGYVLAHRSKLREAFGCGLPYAANLYAFLLLVAGSKDPKMGTSFYSRKALQTHLGLSSKMLRLATDLLMDIGLIDVPLLTFSKAKAICWEGQMGASPELFEEFGRSCHVPQVSLHDPV